MYRKFAQPSLLLCLFVVSGASAAALRIEPNTWTRVARDEKGARRHSSFRYVDRGGFFLQWGFIGHVTEFYGGPESPPEEAPEYDLVYFEPSAGRWQNHLPRGKEEDWGRRLPPLHMCSSYQGITTGSHRPQLKVRDGVLRPDLNVVFDQVAYDSKRARMVFFTGGRTFAYDVQRRTWSDAAARSKKNPPPVLGGSLAYDPFNDEMVLTGGGHVAELGPQGTMVGYTGTWIFDCETGVWRSQQGKTTPPPRMASRLVCDTKNRVMVIFGGDAQSHYRADTWIYDTRSGQWRQSQAFGPPARAGHFAVYDRRSGWVIIGGGYHRGELTDLWAYDAAADRWLKLKGEVPVGWYVTADIAPENSLILLTTSTKPTDDHSTCNEIYCVRTTYAFEIHATELVDTEYEPQVQPEILKRSMMEATTGTRPDAERRKARLKRLHELPVNQWVRLPAPGRSAPLRSWGSCSFDTKRGRIIYWGGGHCSYGGSDYDFYDVEENTWITKPLVAEFPARAWDKGINPAGVTFGGAPWMRHGRKVYAYDPISGKVINTKKISLTAGYEPEPLRTYEPRNPEFGQGENYRTSSYSKWVTWAFDPGTSQWEMVCSGIPGMDLTVTTPNGVMAVDYDWGSLDPGNRITFTPFEELPTKENAVYLLDVAERRWNKLSTGEPGPQNLYEMTALVFDSRRNQLILHGGGPMRTELWTFGLRKRKWRRLDPNVAAIPQGKRPVSRREAVYIPPEDVFLTCSHPFDEPSAAAVFVYRVDENAWYKVAIPLPDNLSHRSIVAQNRALAYDPVHHVVLMVLGTRRGHDVALADVYALRYDHATARLSKM